ncbi:MULTISPECIES: hypothetical protein [Acinetobacter calcoaceticus/baumannii complex]|uniref:hypothetical protein n=1 Tax=Acinetobacter calcoaceticus/baumannii complex TaxID=909768 RepID=UPI000F66E6B2|nr:hypothetical protein [Acinetobacter baumannii]MDC4618914.1 hypothetical protein [Acinetobacter baumannii]MDC5402023.1 hypothetical protein [Acinetobacter baumannii]MDC5462464.1 hypothetical protein [Acinetobacter baumannii]MDC5507986.1 hypothetical protein [Acinetobacter baumannii]MDH2620515.1 hypothetical protein [Acinetobacter baumannii]
MKVEIINHDHLSINLNLEVIPRIGETINIALSDEDSISGIVNIIEHNISKHNNDHYVIIFLRPE